jgi:hypothetical protein
LWERAVRELTEDPMGDDPRVITHSKFRIRLRPDGIVEIVWVPRSTPRLEDAGAAVDAMAELTGGRRSALLVDMRDTGAQDGPTRAEWTRRADLMSATALIVSTPLSRIVGNLFINMNRPATPTRLFDSKDAALAWLRGFTS